MDGALALAIPLKYGQHFETKTTRGCDLVWNAYDQNDKKWFSSRINLFDFKPLKTTDVAISEKLTDILNAACNLNSDFLSTWKGTKIDTKLDFPRHYGWGSSSTLIYAVAQWADVDPYELYELTFGGSGYDIACASAEGAILYSLTQGAPMIENVKWNPSYFDQLYIVHQGQKQNSREAISQYKAMGRNKETTLKVNELTKAFLKADTLSGLQEVINNHESLMSGILNIKPVKERLFSDLDCAAKSLGAWGGDFALLATEMPREELEAYCEEKKLTDLQSLSEIIYQG